MLHYLVDDPKIYFIDIELFEVLINFVFDILKLSGTDNVIAVFDVYLSDIVLQTSLVGFKLCYQVAAQLDGTFLGVAAKVVQKEQNHFLDAEHVSLHVVRGIFRSDLSLR